MEKKRKESGRKEEAAAKLPPLSLYCRKEVSLIDTKFLQTEAYIDAQCNGSYKKKKPKSKGYYRGKMEKNQKQKKTGHNVKSRNGQ